MIELTNEQKELVKSGKEYLKNNNLNGFYDYLNHEYWDNNNIFSWDISNITKWFYEKGIDVLSLLKEKIPPTVFADDAIDKEVLIIPSNIKEIGNSAFVDCQKLTKVRLSEGIIDIGEWAFAGCQSLKDVYLPSTIACIKNYAFESCSSDLTIKCEFNPENINWEGWEKYKDKIVEI